MTYYTDDVNSTIVGGDYMCGYLAYDGRKQTGTLYADDITGLLKLADQQLAEIKAECGPVFRDIYPMENKWELKVIN